jgi:hypothetical protein
MPQTELALGFYLIIRGLLAIVAGLAGGLVLSIAGSAVGALL